MTGAERDHADVLILPPLLFGLCAVAGGAAHVVCPYRFRGAWIPWAGALLAVVSLSIGIWGARTMKASGTNLRPDEPTLAIVERGPFAYSRNPLYLSMIALFTGIGAALRSPAFLAFIVPLALVLRFGVIAREERYLETKFGDPYRGYRARVRRWL